MEFLGELFCSAERFPVMLDCSCELGITHL